MKLDEEWGPELDSQLEWLGPQTGAHCVPLTKNVLHSPRKAFPERGWPAI